MEKPKNMKKASDAIKFLMFIALFTFTVVSAFSSEWIMAGLGILVIIVLRLLPYRHNKRELMFQMIWIIIGVVSSVLTALILAYLSY
ncbi:membrane hypothetical protein [Exiguobacterium sp. 8A]|uniref:hypothetical protein n=1 Tax=Exiguobacterium sp. 8A TaxID=2653139 RepID=UPI0012EF872F|nr:hypothetical protein [Exiguobacterium sp. 8A]VXB52305.1 membrane hypothetical protein [Exiguobacterium sp. 8A]